MNKWTAIHSSFFYRFSLTPGRRFVFHQGTVFVSTPSINRGTGLEGREVGCNKRNYSTSVLQQPLISWRLQSFFQQQHTKKRPRVITKFAREKTRNAAVSRCAPRSTCVFLKLFLSAMMQRRYRKPHSIMTVLKRSYLKFVPPTGRLFEAEACW